MTEDFQLNLSGPGIQVSQAVSREKALELLATLMGVATASIGSPPSFAQHRGPAGAEQDLSIGEFIDGLNVSNNSERLAGIALFLRDRKNQRLVQRDEFPDLFQKTGEALPKNLPRDLREAISKKLLAEDHGQPGHYFVTKTGVGVLRGSAGASQQEPVHSTGSSPAPTIAGRSKAGKKSIRRGAGATKGPTARILALKESGWFKTPRTVHDILAELARKGGNYKRTDLTRLMITLVDRDDLVRSKKAAKEGEKAVWHYSAQ